MPLHAAEKVLAGSALVGAAQSEGVKQIQQLIKKANSGVESIVNPADPQDLERVHALQAAITAVVSVGRGSVQC